MTPFLPLDDKRLWFAQPCVTVAFASVILIRRRQALNVSSILAGQRGRWSDNAPGGRNVPSWYPYGTFHTFDSGFAFSPGWRVVGCQHPAASGRQDGGGAAMCCLCYNTTSVRTMFLLTCRNGGLGIPSPPSGLIFCRQRCGRGAGGFAGILRGAGGFARCIPERCLRARWLCCSGQSSTILCRYCAPGRDGTVCRMAAFTCVRRPVRTTPAWLLPLPLYHLHRHYVTDALTFLRPSLLLGCILDCRQYCVTLYRCGDISLRDRGGQNATGEQERVAVWLLQRQAWALLTAGAGGFAPGEGGRADGMRAGTYLRGTSRAYYHGRGAGGGGPVSHVRWSMDGLTRRVSRLRFSRDIFGTAFRTTMAVPLLSGHLVTGHSVYPGYHHISFYVDTISAGWPWAT